ncbi:S8 family serine peptidase [Kribbella sp. NPDC051587]|uniref:S53 family peptidase n=1 Tax=Kribbella sp. NPDC051587 TaxID=3364119 RepID=UPI0037BBBC89
MVDSDLDGRQIVVEGNRARLAELLSEDNQLDGVVVDAFSTGSAPVVRPLFRSLSGRPQLVYTPLEIAEIYGFPQDTDGSSQVIAIISVAGGYRRADVEGFFADLGLTTPRIEDVSVAGVHNDPWAVGQAPRMADIEATLDLEIAGALAPQARFVNYFAPNTEAGILQATSSAIHAEPTPTVVSMSWGASESSLTAPFIAAMEELLVDAAALGITMCAASGDAGSGNNQYDGGSHVNYPASSPHVLAVGGTSLAADPAAKVIHSETVWNAGSSQATGGGVSRLFGLPSWQTDAAVPHRFGTSEGGRGVPDVAANADANTAYEFRIDGKPAFIGGTSCAAPLWAALVCRLAQAIGRPLGLLQPLIYRELTREGVVAGFRDVVAGDNGAYAARPGWDPTTGLGSPDGRRLLEVLRRRIDAADEVLRAMGQPSLTVVQSNGSTRTLR